MNKMPINFILALAISILAIFGGYYSYTHRTSSIDNKNHNITLFSNDDFTFEYDQNLFTLVEFNFYIPSIQNEMYQGIKLVPKIRDFCYGRNMYAHNLSTFFQNCESEEKEPGISFFIVNRSVADMKDLDSVTFLNMDLYRHIGFRPSNAHRVGDEHSGLDYYYVYLDDNRSLVVVRTYDTKNYFNMSQFDDIISSLRFTDRSLKNISSWQTYRNIHGFEIKYPTQYEAFVPCGGECAAPYDSNYLIISSFWPINTRDDVYIYVNTLGSDNIGTYFSSAKSLDEYLNLIPNTDKDGKVIREFVKNDYIDGQKVFWYKTYGWSVAKQKNDWVYDAFFQHKENIYQISLTELDNENISNLIFSTLKFTK